MARLGLCACLLYLLASPLSTPALGAHLLDAAPPTDVAAEAISPTEVRLTWTDAVGEDTYTILRSTDGGDSWNFYGPYPPDTTSWTDTGVSPCTHYWYRVAALHSGQSLSSGPVAVTTPSSASGGAEPILEESFESLNTPPVPMPEGWQNPGGWVGHTYMGAHDGTYKAMVPSAGGGVLRSPPMNCAGATEVTLSFWAYSNVTNAPTSYYRVSVQGPQGEPVPLYDCIYTGDVWMEYTRTITDPALLADGMTVIWDADTVSAQRAYLDAVRVTRPVPVTPPTAIARQPQDVALCGGSEAAFEVEAVGGDLTYRWQRSASAAPGATWADIPGADGPRLELAGLTPADSGHRVRAIVTGSCGAAYSFPATLTVGSGGAAITAQPAPQAACTGEEVAFSLTAEGEDLTYRWQRDGQDLVDGERIQGAASATLTLTAVDPEDAGSYRCRVGDDACGTLSDAASLTVRRSLRILEQTEDLTACPGEAATLSVTAAGDGLAYQWQFEGADLPGEVGATLVLPAVSPEDAGSYRCVLSGACGTLVSPPATLSVGASPGIALGPQGAVVEEGQGATFSVDAEGVGLTYRWETSADGGLNYTPIPGAEGPTLTTGPLALADDGRLYRCQVRGACGSATSTPAEATVLRVQEIPLEAGWQIVSLNVVPLDLATDALFAGVAERVVSVYAWRAGAWRLYDPATPAASDLAALVPGEGFWIYASAPATLRVAGRVPAETGVPLGAGWTLAGFPAGASRALPEALGDVGVAPDLLYGYGPAGAWRHHDPAAPSWASTLEALVPGQGYWIRTAQETTWTVGY